MRIKSKFKDYYDGFQTHEKDDLIYVREEKSYKAPSWRQTDEEPVPEWIRGTNLQPMGNSVEIKFVDKQKHDFILEEIDVVFCGTRYYGYRVWGTEIVPGTYDNPIERYKPVDHIWNAEKLDLFLRDKEAPKSTGRYSYGHSNRFYSGRRTTCPYQHFSRVDHYKRICIEKKVPVITRGRSVNQNDLVRSDQLLTINGSLEKFGFAKVMPPHLAFQELSMFFGNMTPDAAPMVEIGEKYRIAQHGFDRWSFRKMPSK